MSLHKTKVIAKTVLLRPDKTTLLLKRSLNDDRGPGEWDLPGGTVDEGEDYLGAACREVSEEAGIVVPKDTMGLVFARSGSYARGNRCWLFFLTDVGRDQATLLSHEHSEERWIPIEDAAQEELFQDQQIALKYIVEHILND